MVWMVPPAGVKCSLKYSKMQPQTLKFSLLNLLPS